ncbi:MAG: glycosyltransferase [Azonexus sp.]|nr:glycosyltransferase [Azonexus sp.]
MCFVLTSPFAVNGFLLNHFRILAGHYDITLVVNTLEYSLSDKLDCRVRVVHLAIARQISPLQDMKVFWRLWRFFRSEKFDLVHSMTPKAGLLAMLAAGLAGIPCRIHTFTGQVWATRRGLGRYALKCFDKAIVFAASRVLTDSRSQSSFLEAEGVVKDGEAGVAGPGSISGVDPCKFSPDDECRKKLRNELGIPSDAVVFISLGRINLEKGILDLIHAFSVLATRYQNAWLIIAGPDEGRLAERIVEEVGGGLARLRLIPRVVPAADYLAAADVLVLPSYREGFGTVVLEAAAVGLPTIASRIYGLTDAVQEQMTGLLFPVGDVAALRFAMEAMLDDPECRIGMGSAARQRALQEFSADVVSLAWLAQYRTVLAA